MRLNIIPITLVFLSALSWLSCKKHDYLAANPDQKNIVPQTLVDFQSLLDNAGYMNGYGIGVMPALGEVGGDNYYVVPSVFATDLTNAFYKKVYLWEDDLYQDQALQPQDWRFGYRCIFYANTILDGLSKVEPKPSERPLYNMLYSSALFHRAYMNFHLAQIFAPPYEKNTAMQQLGLPLKLTPDLNEPILRVSLQETYNQIVSDLNASLSGLPETPLHITRPSKWAVYGLLARVYLVMHEYENAIQSATKYLTINSALLDYNTISNSEFFPMPDSRFNPEICFYSILTKPSYELIDPYPGRVDSILLRSYQKDDLRKTLFFKEAASNYGIPGDDGFFFCGSYDASDKLFGGISTDEVYLIRAESYARTDQLTNALDDLNTLMQNRWNNSVPYPVIDAADSQDALEKVLEERRKELVFRGSRWSDLRRLNVLGANHTITRTLDGQLFTLQANSPKYTYLIPPEVISYNPGVSQNPR